MLLWLQHDRCQSLNELNKEPPAVPSEKVGQINFGLEYDYQQNTLILRIIAVRPDAIAYVVSTMIVHNCHCSVAVAVTCFYYFFSRRVNKTVVVRGAERVVRRTRPPLGHSTFFSGITWWRKTIVFFFAQFPVLRFERRRNGDFSYRRKSISKS